MAAVARVAETLIEEIRPLVGRHGVGPETLACALEEALCEVHSSGKDTDPSGEGLQSCLLGIVLWKIFGGKDGLWISSKTEAGHDVPLEVLVTAYAMWEKAVSLAAKYGVDSAAAAEALMAAAHDRADKLAGGRDQRDAGEIRDVQSYMFATYKYMICGIAGKQVSRQDDYADIKKEAENLEVSDKGAFQKVLDSGIYCREFLDALPPKARSVASARYIFGYSWHETAGRLGSSVNAAQKAMSAGVRKVIGSCRRELSRVRHGKLVDIEVHKKRGKKASSGGV